MTAAARHQVAPGRRAMLAKVHLGAKDLGLRDEERRDVLQRITGHRSSADCTDAQLDQVLAHYKALGWGPKPAAGPALQPANRPAAAPAAKRATHPVAMKARAMWISLWHLGVVRQGTEKALEAFAARQLGVDKLQWADQSQGYRLIEALKAMAERNGWSQDLAAIKPERHVWALKARLVQAQARVLGRPAVLIANMEPAELDRLAKELGVEIRAAKGGAE